MTTLLLIEDDRRLTEPLQYQLGMLGYRVLVAHTGPLGLELANSETPDLIVLDIMLPGLTGWQVCEHVREFSQVPIIMLTALGQEVDRLRGLEMGADDYLTKPFELTILIARIRGLLRRRAWLKSWARAMSTPSRALSRPA